MGLSPNLAAFRAEMDAATRRCAFLDHAAIAPLSRRVREAMARFLDCRGSNDERLTDYMTIGERLRAAAARLIGATTEEIAIVQNTSHGLNLVAQSLPLRPGDNVIFCDMEFPSNVYPWMLLERQRRVEARCIPHDGGGLTLEALEAHADERTRVVAVSSVEFLTGFRTDLPALGQWCRQHGVFFVVDGIQSLGAAPLDVRECAIDFLAAGGAKWLMGPVGVGFLYVRRELLDRIAPPMAGCISVVDYENWRDYHLTFLPDASRFHLGGMNFDGIIGLLASIELLMETDIAAIHTHTLHLTDRLIADLTQRGYRIISNLAPERRSAIVTFAVPGDPLQAHARLKQAGVIVSLREGFIRVSPHGYNVEEEVARVGQVLGDAW